MRSGLNRRLSRIRFFCLAGLFALLAPAHLQGQEREPCGGHPDHDCESKADRKKRAVRTYRGGARVVTWRPGMRLPDRMGFRPPCDSQPAARPDPKPGAKPKEAAPRTSRIDRATEEARERKRKAPELTPQVLADLRIGGAEFRRADYEEAVARFKSASEAAPAEAAPLFALAQAYIAQGKDGPAARTIRKAVRLRPELLRAKRQIAAAYGEPVEFDRVMEALEYRAGVSPSNADSRFVLAVQRYFSDDSRSRETFLWLLEAVPDDKVAALFVEAADEKFGPRAGRDEPGKDPARGARTQ